MSLSGFQKIGCKLVIQEIHIRVIIKSKFYGGIQPIPSFRELLSPNGYAK
ncbi:hypothetical protein C5167_046256 [Papaver somniferum]|uniref:Uncharacterized protein n=1 Tax=Papaver somniferum TaxID=3469 RepID=A0A4Y7LDA1_PAPSO|nr:hypothetical protein C5167_046256 [Papaver somniferum]